MRHINVTSSHLADLICITLCLYYSHSTSAKQNAYSLSRVHSPIKHQIDTQRIKSLRRHKAWSQEQLVIKSGLSLRTIQRIEKEGSCSLESQQALAACLTLMRPSSSLNRLSRIHTKQSLKTLSWITKTFHTRPLKRLTSMHHAFIIRIYDKLNL